jgi:hypothetical protein
MWNLWIQARYVSHHGIATSGRSFHELFSGLPSAWTSAGGARRAAADHRALSGEGRFETHIYTCLKFRFRPSRDIGVDEVPATKRSFDVNRRTVNGG